MGNGQWAVVLAVEVAWWLFECEREAGWALGCECGWVDVCVRFSWPFCVLLNGFLGLCECVWLGGRVCFVRSGAVCFVCCCVVCLGVCLCVAGWAFGVCVFMCVGGGRRVFVVLRLAARCARGVDVLQVFLDFGRGRGVVVLCAR